MVRVSLVREDWSTKKVSCWTVRENSIIRNKYLHESAIQEDVWIRFFPAKTFTG